MTGRRTYPLETLLRLRDRIRLQREQGLAAAIRALERAQQSQQQASERTRRRREQITAYRCRLFEVGVAPAAQRAVAEAYLKRLEAEAAHLAAAEARAAEDLRRQEARVSAAREELARAEAELQVVERNREAWSEERRREALARAEAELDDLVAARRPGGRER